VAGETQSGEAEGHQRPVDGSGAVVDPPPSGPISEGTAISTMMVCGRRFVKFSGMSLSGW
jgi:hypothetical protein